MRGQVGNLHKRFASALGLAVEVVEEGSFAVLMRRWVSVQVLMHCFFGISIKEFAFIHDALGDAVGAIATIRVLFQVGCEDVEKAARP